MISLLYFGQPGIFVVSMHLIPHLYARLYKFLCFVQTSMDEKVVVASIFISDQRNCKQCLAAVS